MSTWKREFLFFGAAAMIVLMAALALAAGDGCTGEVIAPGWEQSYKAGYTDRNGHYAGGSEIVHLVGHKGRLYAAVGYWKDSRNIYYGGTDPNAGWGQIVRLDKPGGQWEVDLEMGPRYLRATTLKSITFSTDGNGQALKEPVTLLVSSAHFRRPDGVDVSVFVRNDETGEWDRSTIYTGPKPDYGEQIAVRAMQQYRDKVTGVDRLFVSLGEQGVFSGVYDPDALGKIRWGQQSESGPVDVRPLAIIEANGALLFSAGKRIYRRNDGDPPTYTVVHDMGDMSSKKVFSPVGGIRGMSALANPNGAGESLLFVWNLGKGTRGCVYRLDPDGQGGYKRVKETCLYRLMRDYLNGNAVFFVLAAYNDILSVVDPTTQEPVSLIGFESWIGEHQFPTWMGDAQGGFYAGAMYAIRDRHGKYRLNEVNGPMAACKPVLVSTRTYALSPFKQDKGGVIYFGGHDANNKLSHNTAWIFRTSLENALAKNVPRPQKLKAK